MANDSVLTYNVHIIDIQFIDEDVPDAEIKMVVGINCFPAVNLIQYELVYKYEFDTLHLLRINNISIYDSFDFYKEKEKFESITKIDEELDKSIKYDLYCSLRSKDYILDRSNSERFIEEFNKDTINLYIEILEYRNIVDHIDNNSEYIKEKYTNCKNIGVLNSIKSSIQYSISCLKENTLDFDIPYIVYDDAKEIVDSFIPFIDKLFEISDKYQYMK